MPTIVLYYCKLTGTNRMGRMEMFYLTTHSTHGVSHMVKDRSDSERGSMLPAHGILFPISSKGYFICIILQIGQYIPRPLLHQSWSTGWNENYWYKQ